MSTRTRALSRLALLGVLALAGCGGGGGSSGLLGNVNLAQADWIVVDLVTGQASGRRTAPDLSDDALRTDHMVFVSLPTGSETNTI